MELTSHFNARLNRSSVVSSVFTEKENTFLTANRDGTITVVTFQPKFRQNSKRITNSEITAMAYETDNNIITQNKSFLNQQPCLHRLIIGTATGDLIILSKNLEIITTLHRKHFDRIVKIQFFDNNKYFITASYDCSLKIFDSSTYEYISSFYEHQSWITDFSISPNEKTFITSCSDQKLRLFDIKKKRCIAIIGPFPFVPTTVLFHPGGKHYFIGFTNGVVACYKLKGAKKVLSVQLHKSSVSAISLHTSGLFLASVSVDSTISILEIEKVVIMFSMLVKQKGLNSVTFSKDGWQLMTTSVNGRLTIWDFPFNALVLKNSSRNSSENSNANDISSDENLSNENSFPEVSPRPNNSQTLPVNFQMQNMGQQQQMQLNIPNMGLLSYSQNPPNAVYIPGMINQRKETNSNLSKNPYEFSDSNSFTSVEAQQVNSNGEFKDHSSTSNIEEIVKTDIFVEEEEEEIDAGSQGPLISSEEYEKHSMKSFKEEESERFSSNKSSKEEEEKYLSNKSFKEEENNSNKSFREEESFSSSKFKELLSNNNYNEEDDKKPVNNNNSSPEEEYISSNNVRNNEEEEFISNHNADEEEEKSLLNNKEQISNSLNEEEDNYNIIINQIDQALHTSASRKEEEEENESSKPTRLIQNVQIVIEEEEDSSDIIQYINSIKYSNNIENQNQNEPENEEEEEEENATDFLRSSSSSIEDDDQGKISRNDSENNNLNLNSSLNDTLNEIAIEIKPSNTEESFSESAHDIQQFIESTIKSTINADDNENSFQLNQTEFLTTSDSQTAKSSKSQTKHHNEIEDFNAVFTLNSSAINTESPVYDFNNYSDKENDENENHSQNISTENDRINDSIISGFSKLSTSQPVISNKKDNISQNFNSDPIQYTFHSNKSRNLKSSGINSQYKANDDSKSNNQVAKMNSQYPDDNDESNPS